MGQEVSSFWNLVNATIQISSSDMKSFWSTYERLKNEYIQAKQSDEQNNSNV